MNSIFRELIQVKLQLRIDPQKEKRLPALMASPRTAGSVKIDGGSCFSAMMSRVSVPKSCFSTQKLTKGDWNINLLVSTLGAGVTAPPSGCFQNSSRSFPGQKISGFRSFWCHWRRKKMEKGV